MDPDRDHVGDVSTVDGATGCGFKAWLTASPRRPVVRLRHVFGVAGCVYGFVTLMMEGPSPLVIRSALGLTAGVVIVGIAEYLPRHAVRAAAWSRGTGTLLMIAAGIAYVVAIANEPR